MNWGHKLTLVIIAFIICMGAMVHIAYRQTNDMVDENYYEKEMNYQSLIDASHNLNAVNSDAIIHQNSKEISVQIPLSLIKEFKNGQLVFMKTDDQKKDISFNFTPDGNGLFNLPISKFSTGAYKVRIKWKGNTKDYYREENLIVSK